MTKLIDYNNFGWSRPAQETAAAGASEWEITPEDLKKKLTNGGVRLVDTARGDRTTRHVRLVDVRESHEYEICHLPEAKLVPLSELLSRVNELDSSEEMVVYCHHGVRSRDAVEFLKGAGFRKIKSLRGGIDAWAATIDPSLPRY